MRVMFHCADPAITIAATVLARCQHDSLVNLAVTMLRGGGDGWESNPPRTPQQRPANGFEDRGPNARALLMRLE